MRRKLKDLFIYHTNLDNQETIHLLNAFEKGNLHHIRKQLTRHNVNQSIGVCGFLPLELSIIYDHKHVFDYLIHDLNASLAIKNKALESMPSIALAFQRHNYLFDLLNLDMSCLYDCTNDTQRTLMHQAAINGDTEAIGRLLEDFGFYKNLNKHELQHLLYDKYGCSPLYYACWFGFVQIVELLLNACFEKSNDSILTRLSSSSLRKSIKYKRSTDDAMDFDIMSCGDQSDDDVFLLTPSVTDNAHSDLTRRKHIAKAFQFEDSSLAISILYNQFECAKMIMIRSLDVSCILNKKDLDTNFSSELDSWFGASMKLSSHHEFCEMTNLFHELALNGAKFSHCLFNFIDSMHELSQFNRNPDQLLFLPRNSTALTDGELSNYTFIYNTFFSNFFKSMTFICNYRLEKLFSNERNVEFFLKSIFLKINEMFLVNNNWHMIDMILFSKNHLNETSTQASASYEYFIFNRNALEWFIFDFKQFLKSLYSNGLAFKYFWNKSFFRFLRKRQFISHLIETYLYSDSSSFHTHKTRNLSMSEYIFNDMLKHTQLMHLRVVCEEKIKSLVKPLKLMIYAKHQVKNSLKHLDKTLIERLECPNHLKAYLSSELATGLPNSYQRSKMNKIISK